MAIKENLQRLMTHRSLSEYRLAQVTGVPQPTIHRILTGESADPKNATLAKLAGHFGITVDQLRGAKDVGATTGRFSALSAEAIDILAAWERLPHERQQAFKESLFLEVFALEHMPWLRRGRPKKETYDEFEKRVQALARAHAATSKK